jgi:hypothetical protein
VVAGAASPYALTAEQASELRAVLAWTGAGERPSMRLRALYERFWRLRGEGQPVPMEASDQREFRIHQGGRVCTCAGWTDATLHHHCSHV